LHAGCARTWDGDGQIQRTGSKAQGSGHGEGNGKPAQAANDVALKSRLRLGSDRALPAAGGDRREHRNNLRAGEVEEQNQGRTICPGAAGAGSSESQEDRRLHSLALVNKHGAEVADDVDDAEDKA